MLGRIAGYELLELVGSGGMGVVFRARNARLGSTVAVKILPDRLARNAEYRERFLREARAEASLSHPSIAACFDVGEAELDPPELIPSDIPGMPPAPKLYLTMEFVPGSDLSAIANGEPVAILRVLDLAGQIAAGLEAAHTAGVVHRDLKPANVRVTPDGRVKIVDFGLAATVPRPDSETESFHTSHNDPMGTCYFMSPEQTRGRTTDPRSDLFALGAIVYLLVTGRLPFSGDSPGDIMDSVRHTEPQPLARYANGVPDELERIVRKLMAKDPSARYQSAHEVCTDLARLGDRPSARPLPSRWRALLYALSSVLVLIGAWLVWRYILKPPWRTLAVTPFVNRTGDPRLDYIGDGVVPPLVASLIRNSSLSVAVASLVDSIAPSERARRLAHELGTDATLAGALRKQGEGLRLDLELVEGRHGFVIWAASYDYDLAASDDVERQVVRDVTGRLAGPSGARIPPPPPKPRPGSAYERVLRAWSALDDPDDVHGPERALSYLAQALDQDPDFALAWACRSRALWKIWNRDESEASLRLAEEAANRALRLNPELIEARLARAQIYKDTSRYGEAIRDLTDVLRINPNWDEAELLLAAAYRDAGALAQAESHFRHTTVVRPGYWRNWNSLGTLLYLRGNYAGARDAFRQVIQLAPEKNVGYTMLAAVETKVGNYDAAIDLYEKLPTPVQDGPTAANIGTAYFFMHRSDQAARFYALAARLDPRNINVWVNLGDLAARAGRPDTARARYEVALNLAGDQLHVNPRNGRLQVQRLLCLAKLGRCDEVRVALAAGADTLPADNAELTHQLAKVYAACGRRAEALDAARRAVALGLPPSVLRAEDEFAALVRDPAFPAAPQSKTP